jgi:hypothetical protein
LYLLWEWIVPDSLPWAIAIWKQEAPPTKTAMGWGEAFASQFGVSGALALAALLSMAWADGWTAVGLRPRRPIGEHDHFVSRLSLGPLAVTGAVLAVMDLALWVRPELWEWTMGQSSSSGDGLPGPAWFYIAVNIVDPCTEEIVLLGVMYRLLEYVPMFAGSRGSAKWMGGCAIAALAALRIAYHLDNGLLVITAVPFALLLPILYRETRMLGAMIIVHGSLAFAVTSPTGLLALQFGGCLVVVVRYAWFRSEGRGWRPVLELPDVKSRETVDAEPEP